MITSKEGDALPIVDVNAPPGAASVDNIDKRPGLVASGVGVPVNVPGPVVPPAFSVWNGSLISALRLNAPPAAIVPCATMSNSQPSQSPPKNVLKSCHPAA